MPRGSVPTRCVQCGHPLVANHITPTPAGMRKHSGRGLCSACHKADMRGVERQPENAAPTGFHDQPWSDQALCNQTDPEAFFPEKGGSTREAKQVCNGNADKNIPPCPVRSECLDWALATEQRFGIWGGHSERERRKLKKQEPEQLAATGTDGPTAATTETTDEQPAPRSYGLAYIGGAHAHRPIPLATDVGIRQAHTPRTPRPTGLDWAKHTAPEPEKPAAVQPVPEVLRCRWCRELATDLVDDVCDDCRDTAERQFHAPDHTALGRELADLERTDPKVAAAAASYDDMVDRITRPEDHIKLPTEGKQGQPTTGSSAPGATSTSSTTGRAPVAGSSATTGGTAEKKNPGAGQETRPAPAPGLDVVQMLRGSALSVLAALDHAHHPETPAATPTLKVAAGPKHTRRPANRQHNGPQRLQLPADTIERYNAGATIPQLATEIGVSAPTVRRWLLEHGVQIRAARVNYSPELIEAVRTRYHDHHMTQGEIATDLDVSTKVVQTAMNLAGIDRREAKARVAADNARGLKARITALGVTSRDIKTWALHQGLVDQIARGLPGTALVDAYAAAHPTTTKENQPA